MGWSAGDYGGHSVVFFFEDMLQPPVAMMAVVLAFGEKLVVTNVGVGAVVLRKGGWRRGMGF